MLSRRSELNAFAKSNLMNARSPCNDSTKRRAECTAASHPFGTPTPNCNGESRGASLIVAYLLAHLAASLRHTYPIAIGLMPPVFFCRAISLPPKIIGLTISGISPRNSKLTKAVSDGRRLSATCWPLVKSSRWRGVIPSGPPEEPAGNDRMASRTSSHVT